MRRPALTAATLLAATALVVPAGALPAAGAQPDPSSAEYWQSRDWGGNHWDPAKVGDRWDGGSAGHDGTSYSWPQGTYSYAGKVCPDMDVAKTDVRGEAATLTLRAPEGRLVSAYCVKSGSGDLGPKLVVLDEPAAEVVVAYPAQGRLKAISHYAVEHVDAAATSMSAQAAGARSMAAAAPAPEAATATQHDAEAAGKSPATPVPAPVPTPVPTPVDDGPDEDVDAAATPAPTVTEPEPATTPVAAPAAPSLPLTGAQVAAVAIAALVLLGAGVATLVAVRRRASTD